MSNFENVNNAVVRAASLGGEWATLNEDFQNRVAGQRAWMELVPPLWASTLESYWVRYAKLYAANPAVQGKITSPRDIVPGGLTAAVKELYAPVTETVTQSVQAMQAAAASKLKTIEDAVNAKLSSVAQKAGAEIAKGVQQEIYNWAWGLGGLAIGAGILWLMLRGSGRSAFGNYEDQQRQDVIEKLTRQRNEWRRELAAAKAGKTKVTSGWMTEARNEIVKLGRRIRELGGELSGLGELGGPLSKQRVLRQLRDGPKALKELFALAEQGESRSEVRDALRALSADSMVEQSGGRWRLSEHYRAQQGFEGEVSGGEDVTESMVSDIRGGPMPQHLRKLKKLSGNTEAQCRVLEKYDGLKMGFTSKAPVYDDAVRYISKVEHKMLLGLILGGQLRVVRVSGVLPGEHPESRVGAKAPYHYVLERAAKSCAKLGSLSLPGGRAERAGLRPRDFDPAELERGARVEMEHTDDPRVAREIAMDHLSEDPRYYDALAKMERRLRSGTVH